MPPRIPSQRQKYDTERRKRRLNTRNALLKNPNTKRLCSLCLIIKPLTEFATLKSFCKVHEKRKNLQYRSTLDGYLRSLLLRMQLNAKTRRENGRPEAGTCTVTFEELKDIYNQQNGYCYYFKTKKMSYQPCSEWQISPERLNNELGYDKVNLVLCCFEFNTRRQWTHVKLDHVIELRGKVVDIQEFEKNVRGSKNDTYDFLARLNHDCRQSSAKRLFKDPIKGECTINVHKIIDKVIEQAGKCAISGIPLCFKSGSDWQASIERIRVPNGYIDGNWSIICLELQSTTTRGCQDKNLIGAQWNKIKWGDVATYLESKQH